MTTESPDDGPGSTRQRPGSTGEYLRTAVRGILADSDLRALFAVYLLLFVVTELYRQALPLYFRALGIPIAVLGVGKSLATLLEVVASPLAGGAADARDRFALAAGAGVVLAGAFALLGVARTPAALVAVMAVVAVARLTLSNAATPAISAALDEEFAGVGWGIRDVAVYGGATIGLALGGVVLSAVESVGTAFVALVPVLAVMTALLWWNRDAAGDGHPPGDGRGGGDTGEAGSGAETGEASGDDAGGDDGGDPEDRSRLARARVALSLPAVPNPPVMARFAAVKALSSFGMGMSLFLLPVLAVDLGIGAADFLFLFSATFAVSAPLSVLGGVAADRFDRKRLYVGNFLAETLMLAAFAVTGSLPLFLVGTAFYVAQTAFEPAVITFFFAAFADEEKGTAWGISGTVSKGAGVLAPAVGGYLYDAGSTLVFALGAALLAGATLVALTVPRPD